MLLRGGAPWSGVGAFTVVLTLVFAARHDDGSFPLEELVNWALFVYLGAALPATLRRQSPKGLYRRAPVEKRTLLVSR